MYKIGGALVASVGALATVAAVPAWIPRYWVIVGAALVLVGFGFMLMGIRRDRKAPPPPPPRVDVEDSGDGVIEDNKFRATGGSLLRARRSGKYTIRRNEES